MAAAIVLPTSQASADAGSGTPVCGQPVAISGSDTASTPAVLSVPQYSGTGTLTSAVLSIGPTESFHGSFIEGTPPYSPYPGTATQDFVAVSTVLEATGPGLSSLSPVTVGAPANGFGPDSWTAGVALPALPAGIAAAEGTAGAGAGTTSATHPSWTALGFSFTPDSPAPATAEGTIPSFSQATASIPAASLTAYSGSGNVAIDGADYSIDTVSSDSAGFNGASVTTTIEACVTYTAVVAETPEAPSVLLLPATAAVVGLGAFIVARRRRTGLDSI